MGSVDSFESISPRSSIDVRLVTGKHNSGRGRLCKFLAAEALARGDSVLYVTKEEYVPSVSKSVFNIVGDSLSEDNLNNFEAFYTNGSLNCIEYLQDFLSTLQFSKDLTIVLDMNFPSNNLEFGYVHQLSKKIESYNEKFSNVTVFLSIYTGVDSSND